MCNHPIDPADSQMNIHVQNASHHPLGPGVSVSLHSLPMAPEEQLEEVYVLGLQELQR